MPSFLTLRVFCTVIIVTVMTCITTTANAITCERGYYRESETATECLPCPMGTYGTVLSDLYCATPGGGWYADRCAEDGTACVAQSKCPAGSYCTDGIIQGICPVGTYSGDAYYECKVPYRGVYATNCAEDGTACTTTAPCPIGFYCNNGIKHPCNGPLQYQNTEKADSCKTVSVGYYKVDDTAQAACDDGYNDIAAPSRDECVGTFSKTGNALPPAEIDGCVSSTIGTCTPDRCNYTMKFDGTVLTDCSADCVKPRTCNSCAANRYLDDNVCPLCSALDGGMYPFSANVNSGGAAACYQECVRPCAQQGCPENATCVYGNASTAGKWYYGAQQCDATELTCDIIEYTCNDGHQKTHTGACAQICTATITKLRTSNDVIIPLYNTKQTSPAITVLTGTGHRCYANLIEGAGTATINVQYKNVIYHAVN